MSLTNLLDCMAWGKDGKEERICGAALCQGNQAPSQGCFSRKHFFDASEGGQLLSRRVSAYCTS